MCGGGWPAFCHPSWSGILTCLCVKRVVILVSLGPFSSYSEGPDTPGHRAAPWVRMRKWGPPGTGVVLCFMVVAKQLLAWGEAGATLLSLVHRFQLLGLLLSLLWAPPRGWVRFSGTCRRRMPRVGWAFRADVLDASPSPNSPPSSGPGVPERQGLGTGTQALTLLLPRRAGFPRSWGLWDWMGGAG